MVALDVGRGDDVDDGLGAGGVFGRGVGDGLDAVEGIGRKGLEVGFEVLFRQSGGFVVHPNLDAGDAAQRDVAFNVHLHARGVL